MTSRHLRPVIVALVALFVVAGTAFAARPVLPILGDPGASASPVASHSVKPDKSAKPKANASAKVEVEDSDTAPAAAEIDRVVAKLKDAGITTPAADVAAMASKVGLGGAVRVFVFAHESGKTPAQILAMFQSGEGWGQIAKDLNLKEGPGLGGIMGNGHGKGNGNGNGNGHDKSGSDD